MSFLGETCTNRTFGEFLSSSFAPSMRFLTVILLLFTKKKAVRQSSMHMKKFAYDEPYVAS